MSCSSVFRPGGHHSRDRAEKEAVSGKMTAGNRRFRAGIRHWRPGAAGNSGLRRPIGGELDDVDHQILDAARLLAAVVAEDEVDVVVGPVVLRDVPRWYPTLAARGRR
ncbi:hypothetical protein [Corallococcus macrosporus]|uniref:hypothetical protein n=1 Tax=Corallococcus macrosporus TaxID=35 RepID=UPI000F4D5543|nr:hypothetical protein [Corallococcus macrosporus]